MTKQIPLSQGKFALVDDEWFDTLAQWKWCYHKSRMGNGYAERAVYRKDQPLEHIKMHRFIMGCSHGDGIEIDHKDDNGLNNQTYNLRRATDTQNSQNRRLQPNNTSGYKGVYRYKNGWGVALSINHKRKFFGLYPTKEEAALIYDKLAMEHYGEFARLNFPNSMPSPSE